MQRSEEWGAESPERAALCDAVLRAPVGWLDLDSVVRRSSLDRETALDTLAELHLIGWIQIEEMEGHEKPVLSLSPYGAEQLGVVVYERGEAFAWRPTSRLARTHERVLRQPHVTGFPYEGFAEQILDPQPSPLDALTLAEEPLTPDPYPELGAPRESRPSLVLGIDVPWFAVGGVSHGRTFAQVREKPTTLPFLISDLVLTSESCPGCGSRPLPANAACVYPGCDRWGAAEKPSPVKRRSAAPEAAA